MDRKLFLKNKNKKKAILYFAINNFTFHLKILFDILFAYLNKLCSV